MGIGDCHFLVYSMLIHVLLLYIMLFSHSEKKAIHIKPENTYPVGRKGKETKPYTIHLRRKLLQKCSS
jgi:hypothetical protein